MAYSSGSAAIEPEIASITLSVVLFASDGRYQSTSAKWTGTIDFATTLTNSDGSITLGTFSGSLEPKVGQEHLPYIVTLTPTSPVFLADNTDFKVTLALTDKLSAGTFVGLSSISYTLVPEPTTALLTLPALGALLLRRRRRS